MSEFLLGMLSGAGITLGALVLGRWVSRSAGGGEERTR